MGRKYLLLVTALTEGGTGLALAAAPDFVLSLLLGVTSAAPETMLIGRVAGGALVAIAIVCRAVRGDGAGPAERGVVLAVLVYDGVAGTVLMWAGASWGMIGVALWPAVAAHIALAAWCLTCLVGERRAGTSGIDMPGGPD